MYKMLRTKRVMQTKYVLSETEYALVLKARETIKQLTGVAPGEIIVLKDYLEDLEKKAALGDYVERLVNLYDLLVATPEVFKHDGIRNRIFDSLNDLSLLAKSKGKYRVDL